MLATIGIIIDVAIILALIVYGIIGIKKGLFKSILSLFNWTVCLIVAFLLAKYVANLINGIFDFSKLIGNKIANGLNDSNEFFKTPINSYASTDAIINAIPQNTNGLIKQLIKVVFSNKQVDLTSADSIGNIVGLGLGQIIMTIISGILVFVVLKIVLKLLNKIFDKITSGKLMGGLNRILGMLFGIAKAFVIVLSINIALVTLTLIPMVNRAVNPLVQENTYVEKVAYNITDKFVGKTIIEGNLIKNWTSDLWNKRK